MNHFQNCEDCGSEYKLKFCKDPKADLLDYSYGLKDGRIKTSFKGKSKAHVCVTCAKHQGLEISTDNIVSGACAICFFKTL